MAAYQLGFFLGSGLGIGLTFAAIALFFNQAAKARGQQPSLSVSKSFFVGMIMGALSIFAGPLGWIFRTASVFAVVAALIWWLVSFFCSEKINPRQL